jgi:hypothetical protein
MCDKWHLLQKLNSKVDQRENTFSKFYDHILKRHGFYYSLEILAKSRKFMSQVIKVEYGEGWRSSKYTRFTIFLFI